jgi:hypothetical protein
MNPDLDQIRARQKRITDEIAKLQREFDELDVALRVMDRFSKSKPPDKPPKPKRPKKAALRPRPAGTPSTFEMVETILSEAEKAGKSALTSRELMDQIREKFWPGVQNKQILPSIFGFAPKRLTRDGDKWKRKREPIKNASLF